MMKCCYLFRCNTKVAESLKCLIDIQGMKCQSCVRKITNKLSEIEGITSALISLELKEGAVIYDTDLISPSQIVEIVQSLGFVSMLKLSTTLARKGMKLVALQFFTQLMEDNLNLQLFSL